MAPLPTGIELAMFSKQVGDDFRVHFGAEFRTATLIEATGDKRWKADPSAPVHSFSLLFHDPAATVTSYLAQGTYRFEHDELGSLEMFMVPVGPDKQSTGICYQVIFNSRSS